MIPWIIAGWSAPASGAAPVTVEWGATTSFVPGLWAPAAEIETLTGTWTDRGVFDPRLRFGLSARVAAQLTARDTLSASWGVWRDQALCDTCGADTGPGWLGSELLGSTDLSIRYGHRRALEGGAALTGIAEIVLPASRDALACNPMIAAPGLGASFDLPAGGSRVGLSVVARRPIFTHEAAPIGLCSPKLAGDAEVVALTGAVEPESFDGAWFGAANPTLSATTSAEWRDPLQLVPKVPDALRSGLSTGLQLERRDADPSVQVLGSSGLVTVAAASRPVRVTVPWQVSLGWAFSRRLGLDLSAGNRVPAVLADPGGTLRALPATTSFSAALSGRL